LVCLKEVWSGGEVSLQTETRHGLWALRPGWG